MAQDGYPKVFTAEQYLAAIYAQTGGADEGWISVNRVATDLGMERRHAHLTLRFLERAGVIQVIESKQGVGTHVRIGEGTA